MDKIKVNVIVLTYHLDNLMISLPALNNLPYDIKLIVHNDNPKVRLTSDLISDYGWGNQCTIINEELNQGMLMSRLNSLDSIDHNNQYTIYCDDDDILLGIPDLNFTTPKCSIQYSALRNVRQLLKYFNMGIIPINEVELRYGVSGNIYRTNELINYSKILKEFFPTIESIMGTSIINSGEDDIFDGLYYKYYHAINNNHYSTNLNTIGYLWNQIESTVGRYGDFSGDCRYSNNPNKTDRDKLIKKLGDISKLFSEFLLTK